MMHLPSLRTLNAALPWVIVFGGFAAWVGWLQSPEVETRRVRDEWVKAHATAAAQIENQGKQIVILQEQSKRAKEDRDSTDKKVDDILRIVYRLDRRTR